MGELDLTGSGAKPLRADDPRQIGGIPLAGRLGSGGMGRVYLGVHEGRYVAVKQVLPAIAGEDQGFVRRFGHELDNLSRLPAEATAPLIASDRDASPPWLATAYVPGLTLNEAIGLHEGPLPPEAVWLLLREAARGLVPVHELGMVHRDLKPSNIMLTVEGATVIDFGVARAAEQSLLTMSGMVVGTPAYMAPEQATTRRDLTGAADVFALASVIAYAAGGRPPFGEESGPAVLYRIVHEEPDLRAVRELDPELADLVAACLAKDVEARPTASELVLRAAEHGPFTPPLWPDSVAGSLMEKAAFAAHVQKIELPPPASMETMRLGQKARPKRERRRRAFFAVVPVVIAVGGATLAFQILPYAFDADDGHAAAGPSVSASAAVDPTASGSGAPSPSGSAKPGKSPTGAEKSKSAEKAGGRTGESTAPVPGAGDTGGGSGDAGGSDGAGGGGTVGAASGGSSGSGSSGGSSGSGTSGGGSSGSGGSGTGGSTTPSGTQSFRNGGNGECLVGARFASASTGGCGGAAATWTVRPLSDGSGGFQLVESSGKSCLTANIMNGGNLMLNCNESSSRRWRAGSGGTIVSEDTGGCLQPGNGGVTTAKCSGAASQRWTTA
ncbi:serine/threonine-protein kinase [Streptomyces sp. NPDC051784]|uniref:serine/threonine-protein kinase n=1 Tax=Streptomyces sp. NPDC051784 TaxID=3155805 RepID=UPI003438652E